MTLEVLGFWALAIVLVGSALAVVTTKNLFHSVLWLALALTGTAGIFLMLNAEFLAGVQILLYAGGVVTDVVAKRPDLAAGGHPPRAHEPARVAGGRGGGRVPWTGDECAGGRGPAAGADSDDRGSDAVDWDGVSDTVPAAV